mmetsp:Transcript_2920/g.8017  ORF Transcript_2920/g.8017 Transcript_2920/m.8017 type:complete len:348 (+) Transcript_2920:741-1784(+)
MREDGRAAGSVGGTLRRSARGPVMQPRRQLHVLEPLGRPEGRATCVLGARRRSPGRLSDVLALGPHLLQVHLQRKVDGVVPERVAHLGEDFDEPLEEENVDEETHSEHGEMQPCLGLPGEPEHDARHQRLRDDVELDHQRQLVHQREGVLRLHGGDHRPDSPPRFKAEPQEVLAVGPRVRQLPVQAQLGDVGGHPKPHHLSPGVLRSRKEDFLLLGGQGFPGDGDPGAALEVEVALSQDGEGVFGFHRVQGLAGFQEEELDGEQPPPEQGRADLAVGGGLQGEVHGRAHVQGVHCGPQAFHLLLPQLVPPGAVHLDERGDEEGQDRREPPEHEAQALEVHAEVLRAP